MAEEVKSAEDRVEDLMFGPEEPEERDVRPVPEGEESEPEEAEEGSEEESEEETEEPEEEEPFVEIEIDGEVLSVPEKYKDYFLRQEDYTKKTQEVATQRKEAELLREQAQTSQKQYEFQQSIMQELMDVQNYQTLAEQYTNYLRENIDNLSSQDIEKIRFQKEEAMNQANQLQNTLQHKWTEFQQAQEQSFKELLNQGTEVLKQKIPNWGEESQKQVREFALANGFTEQEVSNVVDPRQVEVLWKAAQYDNLKKGAKPAVQKVKKTPQIQNQPRKKPMAEDTKEYLSARKKLKSSKDSRGHRAAAETIVGNKLKKLGF